MMLASRKIRILAKVGAALAILTATGAVLSAATDQPIDTEAEELLSPEDFADIADPAERSAAIFTEAAKVFQHPRCLNCHVEDDRPRQGENSQLHEPPVRRGETGFGVAGLQCQACHTTANFEPSNVPGADNWHLAPVEMAWLGKTVPEICAQLKDPKSNGDRTLEELVTHVSADPLVTWGWDPGAKRESAPGTQAVFTSLIQAWVDDGAVCPEPAAP